MWGDRTLVPINQGTTQKQEVYGKDERIFPGMSQAKRPHKNVVMDTPASPRLIAGRKAAHPGAFWRIDTDPSKSDLHGSIPQQTVSNAT